MLAGGMPCMAFIMLRYVPSMSNLLRVFIMSRCWILSNALLSLIIIWDDQMIYSVILLTWCVVFVDFLMLNYPCIPEVNPTWSWYTILLMRCWIWCASIYLRKALLIHSLTHLYIVWYICHILYTVPNNSSNCITLFTYIMWHFMTNL